MSDRVGRLVSLAIGTVVLVVCLHCVGEFMFHIGLTPVGVVFRIAALLFLGIAPLAGLWDFTQGDHDGTDRND